MVVDSKGSLNLFWLNEEGEEDTCTNLELDPENPPPPTGYGSMHYVSGILLRHMILVCGGSAEPNETKGSSHHHGVSSLRNKIGSHKKDNFTVSNRCWYWHKDQPNPYQLHSLPSDSNIPINVRNIDPKAHGQVLMASTIFIGDTEYYKDGYVDNKYHFYLLVLATFDGIRSGKYKRHFFGGKVSPNCVEKPNATQPPLESILQTKQNSDLPKPPDERSKLMNCSPTIEWKELAAPEWDETTGVVYPCAIYYGLHFVLLGASISVRMPEWGGMYYDADANEWKDFGRDGKPWNFPGRPREYFGCGIYRNNLIFSGGLYPDDSAPTATKKNQSKGLIASDTHTFSIMHSLNGGNPWDVHYNISPHDDGNGKDRKKICPVWQHTLATVQKEGKDMLLSVFGCTDIECEEHNDGVEIYVHDYDTGEWHSMEGHFDFMNELTHHIGVVLPMSWLPGCEKKSKASYSGTSSFIFVVQIVAFYCASINV